jgi:hypothetical protein
MTNNADGRVISQEMEVFVVIKEGADLYYLLKVERRNFDIYCFLPDLGIHHSIHESGESHFKHEKKTGGIREEPPVALIMGEAGTPIKNGIKSTSISGLGRSVGICTAIFLIASLNMDFRKFNRKPRECFVIDKDFVSGNVAEIEVGVWAVPGTNKKSFEWNHRNIPAELLYKVDSCEPQIWIYVSPI